MCVENIMVLSCIARDGVEKTKVRQETWCTWQAYDGQGWTHIGLRVKMSWMSLIVRVASIGGPGRMLRRCFVVFNICWTLGKTRAT